jgi:FMN phosphatase YigB (HAD superfamily)
VKRVNFWDFDGVLADSEPVVAWFASRFPEVEGWKWWHEPETSTLAALETPPIFTTWEALAQLPGRHFVLTARCKPAVEAWLELHREGPLRSEIELLEGVFSTSSEAAKHIPAAVKKARFIARFIADEDPSEVHFFDDSLANLATSARIPRVRCWLAPELERYEEAERKLFAKEHPGAPFSRT